MWPLFPQIGHDIRGMIVHYVAFDSSDRS